MHAHRRAALAVNGTPGLTVAVADIVGEKSREQREQHADRAEERRDDTR